MKRPFQPILRSRPSQQFKITAFTLVPPAMSRLGNPVYVFATSAFAATQLPSDMLAQTDADDLLMDPLPRAVSVPRPDVSAGQIRKVVLFVMESVSARVTSGYDGPFDATPNLASYAPISLRISDAYTHVPASNYALVSILAGIVPEISAYGMADNRTDLRYA